VLPVLIDIDAPNPNNGVDRCCWPTLDALKALIGAVKWISERLLRCASKYQKQERFCRAFRPIARMRGVTFRFCDFENWTVRFFSFDAGQPLLPTLCQSADTDR
jgi:hypothetical protein